MYTEVMTLISGDRRLLKPTVNIELSAKYMRSCYIRSMYSNGPILTKAKISTV